MTIQDVTEPIISIDPRREPERQFTYVDIGSIDNRRGVIVDPKSITGATAPSRARRVIRKDDTLFSTVRTYLKNIARVPCELDGHLTSTGISVLRPSRAVDPGYLLAWCRSSEFVGEISRSQDGTMYPAVSDSDVANGPLPLPPLPEQRRIVAKLDRLTARSAAARDHLSRTAKLAAHAKQAILAAAFDAASENGEIGIEDLIVEPIRNGLSVRGADEPPGIPALRLSALRGRTVDLRDVRYLPISLDRARPYILRERDILISRGNGNLHLLAIASIVPAAEDLIIFPDTAFRVRICSGAGDPGWFALMWSAPQTRNQIERLAKTTAGIWKISQSDLRQVRLPRLECAAQSLVAGQIEAAFARIDRLTAEAVRAAHLLDRLDERLLAKAFRGELVPQDPADEPVEALLARIREERSQAAPRPRARRGRLATS